MNSRRHRIPPTFADKRRRLAAVVTEHVEPGRAGVYRVAVGHEDGCPALESQALVDCTCDPTFDRPERLA